MAFALGKLAPERLGAAHEHLDVCAACQRILTDAAHALGTAVTDGEPSGEEVHWNTTFQRGALVGGRYEIREFIARGGMGEVYEAFDQELHERVALKTVSSTACDNLRAVKRLKAEVQLARRVSHPNVCRIYDFGSHALATGTQLYFLTMEFVEGETLGQRVRLAGALPEAEARKLARELLLGLGAAHEAGVLHRDFKSDNVMLKVAPDGTSSAVILDFGLARAADGQDAASGSNSQLVGTFGYIAPERLDGRPYTTASDLYAFGVVWFEMLTGELPFSSPVVPTVSALRTLGRPPLPSRVNPSVPPALDAVVLRCIDRSPATRYQTVSEVLQALDAVEASVTPAWRRKLPPVAFAAGAALAIVYFLAGRPPRLVAETSATPTADPSPAPRAVPEPAVLAPSPVPPPVVPEAPTQDASSRRRANPSRAKVAAAAPAAPSAASSEPPAAQAADSGPAPVVSATAAVRSPPAPAAPSSRPRKPDWEDPFSGTGAGPVAGTKE